MPTIKSKTTQMNKIQLKFHHKKIPTECYTQTHKPQIQLEAIKKKKKTKYKKKKKKHEKNKKN